MNPQPVRILVVDDEQPIREAFAGILTEHREIRRELDRMGTRLFGSAGLDPAPVFDLTLCAQGAEAVDAVRDSLRSGQPYAIVMLDVRMPPGINGVETAERIRALDREVNLVILTGYTDIDPEEITLRAPPAEKLIYLQKPCRAMELRQLAVALSARWQAERSLHTMRDRLQAQVERQGQDLARTASCLKGALDDRKRVEKKLQQSGEQLLRAHRMVALGTLVSGVAHEISNPNNVVLLNVPVLQRLLAEVQDLLNRHSAAWDGDDIGGRSVTDAMNEAQGMLSGISGAADRIARLVSDLKGFAGSDQPQLTEDVEIPALVHDAVNLMQPVLKKATRNFEMDCDRPLPPVRGSMRRLEQVLLNLLTNACHALRSREERIRVCTGVTPDGWVRIEIEDEGIGISTEDLQRITEPFFTTRRDAGGSGLGLSVSLSIVQRHGGELCFSSKEKHGTRAVILLPPADQGGTHAGS